MVDHNDKKFGLASSLLGRTLDTFEIHIEEEEDMFVNSAVIFQSTTGSWSH